MAELLKTICMLALIFSSFEVAADPSTLRIAIGNSKISFDPLSMPNQNTLWISRQINCQLTRLQDGDVKGEAAESSVFDQDKQELVFKLKHGLTFTDDSPLRVEDVEASLNYYWKQRPFDRNTFEWIKKIKSDSKLSEIRIEYRGNPTQLLKNLSSPLFPIFKASNLGPKSKTDWQLPVGCGAYQLDSAKNGIYELTRRSDRSKHVVFKVFPDNELPTELVTSFDIVSIPTVSPVTIPGYKVLKIYDPYQIYIGVNTGKSIWKSRAARCAALAGFDPSSILELYGSVAELAPDYYPRGAFGFNPNATFQSEFKNVSKTEALHLAKHSSCVAIVRASVPRSKEAAYLKNSAIGNLSSATIVNAADFPNEFANTKCDFLVIGLKSNSLDGYEFQVFYSEPKTNFMQYFDDELSKLITKTQNQDSKANRFSAYQDIAKNIAHSCTIRPLVTLPYKIIMVRDSVKINGLGFMALNNVFLDWQ